MDGAYIILAGLVGFIVVIGSFVANELRHQRRADQRVADATARYRERER